MLPAPDYLRDALEEWETIAYHAYDGYEQLGRGVLAVEPDAPGRVTFMFVPAEFFEAKQHVDVTRLVDIYDPATEFLVQYQHSAEATRTIRIRTPEGGRDPKRIWFFRMLALANDQPEALPNYLPDWFLQTLEKLSESADKAGESDTGEDAS